MRHDDNQRYEDLCLGLEMVIVKVKNMMHDTIAINADVYVEGLIS